MLGRQLSLVVGADAGNQQGPHSEAAGRADWPNSYGVAIRASDGRDSDFATGLSFGLIHPRPSAFAGVRVDCVRARRGRRRPVVNAGAHCWKACWGQPLASSDLASSATLTCVNAGTHSVQIPPGGIGPVSVLGSVIDPIWCRHRRQSRMFSLVRGVAGGPDQETNTPSRRVGVTSGSLSVAADSATRVELRHALN
jgi:hypothetical protein